MQGYHIHVTLDQKALVQFRYFRFGSIDAQQRAAFDIDFRLGGIYVFGRIIRAKCASGKAYDPAGYGENRKHDPLPEPIRQSSVVVFQGKTHLH